MPSNVGDVHPVTDKDLHIDADIIVLIDTDRDTGHHLLPEKLTTALHKILGKQAYSVNVRKSRSNDIRHHILMDMNDSQIDLIGLFHLWASASVFNIFSRKCVVTSPFKNDGWLTISLCSGMVVLIGAT